MMKLHTDTKLIKLFVLLTVVFCITFETLYERICYDLQKRNDKGVIT